MAALCRPRPRTPLPPGGGGPAGWTSWRRGLVTAACASGIRQGREATELVRAGGVTVRSPPPAAAGGAEWVVRGRVGEAAPPPARSCGSRAWPVQPPRGGPAAPWLGQSAKRSRRRSGVAGAPPPVCWPPAGGAPPTVIVGSGVAAGRPRCHPGASPPSAGGDDPWRARKRRRSRAREVVRATRRLAGAPPPPRLCATATSGPRFCTSSRCGSAPSSRARGCRCSSTVSGG